MAVKTLLEISLDRIVYIWDQKTRPHNNFTNLPTEIASNLLTRLLSANKISDTTVCEFLNFQMQVFDLAGCSTVKKSVLRSIGYNCTNLTYLKLSYCSQVNNTVVRSILQGCHNLRQLYLDGCHRVSDNGFDLQHSPFQLLFGCMSLETLSVSDCTQITGQLIASLRKLSRNLKELNLSGCKSLLNFHLADILTSGSDLETLNLSRLPQINDDTMTSIPNDFAQDRLRHLNMSNCQSELTSFSKLRTFSNLRSLHLQNCLGLTDSDLETIVSKCSLITALGLSNCEMLGNLALEVIGAYLNDLEWLDLSWCSGISSGGIWSLNSLPSLREILLVWCIDLTDKIFEPMLNMIRYGSLRLVNLNGCIRITENGL
eukprot:CAMPEP_0171452848 /NCGR_PEP_ID=MMETSP0945-20130129/792_1 /TAXON_ID=109269 /ORGANISM="Vaucheria litorea, Strain CCMP2940" /LENGTH=371 /DNA_ID=CAMNT_0011977597 /DNA_START=164 /DNA_END=1276 /DNA_ORIENTATION=-